MENYYCKIISNCLDCKECKIEKNYIPDSYVTYCTSNNVGKRKLIDSGDIKDNVPIPNWCAYVIKNNENLFNYAGVKTVKDVDKLIKRIVDREETEVGELVKSLIYKGLAYEQAAWERDIAISQLDKIGLKFGENPDHIVEIIEHAKMLEDDLR